VFVCSKEVGNKIVEFKNLTVICPDPAKFCS
jgi:hypothetical protein